MTENNEKQVYELSYLVLPSIAEDKVSEVVTKIKGAVAQVGGEVFAEEAPIQMELAYTMDKVVGASRYVVNEAYIGWVKFEAVPADVAKLSITINSMDEVVRSLLIKAPRETEFTFAKAKEALLKDMESESEVEAEAPVEVV